MKRFLLPAALVAATLSAAGCVDDELSLVINRFIGLDATQTCQPSISSTIIQTSGTFDVAIDQAGANSGFHGFTLVPVVVNNLIITMTSTSAETNAIQLNGFDVQLQPDKNDPVLQAALPTDQRSFRVPAAGGVLTPGGTLGTTSQVALFVEVIPQAIAASLNSSLSAQPATASAAPRPLIVHMRPVGMRAGLKINGGYTDFPVTICRGCLGTTDMACPAGGFDPTVTTIQKSGCFPWQDFPVTCCTQMGQLLCGSQVPVKTK